MVRRFRGALSREEHAVARDRAAVQGEGAFPAVVRDRLEPGSDAGGVRSLYGRPSGVAACARHAAVIDAGAEQPGNLLREPPRLRQSAGLLEPLAGDRRTPAGDSQRSRGSAHAAVRMGGWEDGTDGTYGTYGTYGEKRPPPIVL